MLLQLAAAAVAAGMSTHTMVGDRTARFYGKISGSPSAARYNAAIAAQLDAVHGGADFPDFGYLCGSNHSAGEAAHWPPWQAAAATYIRGRPDFAAGNWSEATEKLVAFVLGVSVHYAADEMWEGLTGQLSRGQGFVRTLSSFNLGHPGTTDDDESVANLAADFGVSWALNGTRIKPWRRYFPIEDIKAIYALTDTNVTLESLEKCAAKHARPFLLRALMPRQLPRHLRPGALGRDDLWAAAIPCLHRRAPQPADGRGPAF